MVLTKRRGLSETLGTFILIATAIAGSAIAVYPKGRLGTPKAREPRRWTNT